MPHDDIFYAQKYKKKFQKLYDNLQARKEGFNVSINSTENIIREQDFLDSLIGYCEQFIED